MMVSRGVGSVHASIALPTAGVPKWRRDRGQPREPVLSKSLTGPLKILPGATGPVTETRVAASYSISAAGFGPGVLDIEDALALLRGHAALEDRHLVLARRR